MREADGRRIVTRVKGRPALEKRLRALLVAVHRYGRCRARTRDEQVWTAMMLDTLTAALSCDEPVNRD